MKNEDYFYSGVEVAGPDRGALTLFVADRKITLEQLKKAVKKTFKTEKEIRICFGLAARYGMPFHFIKNTAEWSTYLKDKKCAVEIRTSEHIKQIPPNLEITIINIQQDKSIDIYKRIDAIKYIGTQEIAYMHGSTIITDKNDSLYRNDQKVDIT